MPDLDKLLLSTNVPSQKILYDNELDILVDNNFFLYRQYLTVDTYTISPEIDIESIRIFAIFSSDDSSTGAQVMPAPFLFETNLGTYSALVTYRLIGNTLTIELIGEYSPPYTVIAPFYTLTIKYYVYVE